MLSNTSSDFDLTIRQQPDRARVAGGKEKGNVLFTPSSHFLDSLERLWSLDAPRLYSFVRGRGCGSEPRGRSGERSDPQSLTRVDRAQTHRSAPDRPAPGARGGFLPGAVSELHRNPNGVAWLMRMLTSAAQDTTCKAPTISCAAACTMPQKIVQCPLHHRQR